MLSYVSSLLGFGSEQRQPPTVPTDEILPLGMFDDSKVLRVHTLTWTFRFDDILDPDMLSESLTTLLQMEGWRKLGGRIRLNSQGKAEIHVPTPFTKERPPIYFTKAEHMVSMREHPDACHLPGATEKPEMFAPPCEYRKVTTGPGTPMCFEDYLYSDMPLFALHVVTFTDGTLVSTTFNHIISDLGGRVAIINAWQHVLAGRPDMVPPFMGFRDDPMEGLYKASTKEKYILADKKMGFWNFARFGLWTMFDTWWNAREPRLVCVPSKVVANMMKQTRDQLKQTDATKDAFISDVNILVAGFVRAVASELPANKPITLLQAVDPRPRIPSIFNPDAVYVCNAPAAIFSPLNAGRVCQQGISELALDLRQDLVAQLQEEQMKAVAAIAYDHMLNVGYPAMFGESNASLIVSSSWIKADFYRKMDFSPAVVGSGANIDRPSEAKPGRPVYFHGGSGDKSAMTPNTCVLMGKDLDQNLWLIGFLPSSTWPRLMDYFNQFV